MPLTKEVLKLAVNKLLLNHAVLSLFAQSVYDGRRRLADTRSMTRGKVAVIDVAFTDVFEHPLLPVVRPTYAEVGHARINFFRNAESSKFQRKSARRPRSAAAPRAVSGEPSEPGAADDRGSGSGPPTVGTAEQDEAPAPAWDARSTCPSSAGAESLPRSIGPGSVAPTPGHAADLWEELNARWGLSYVPVWGDGYVRDAQHAQRAWSLTLSHAGCRNCLYRAIALQVCGAERHAQVREELSRHAERLGEQFDPSLWNTGQWAADQEPHVRVRGALFGPAHCCCRAPSLTHPRGPHRLQQTFTRGKWCASTGTAQDVQSRSSAQLPSNMTRSPWSGTIGVGTSMLWQSITEGGRPSASPHSERQRSSSLAWGPPAARKARRQLEHLRVLAVQAAGTAAVLVVLAVSKSSRMRAATGRGRAMAATGAEGWTRSVAEWQPRAGVAILGTVAARPAARAGQPRGDGVVARHDHRRQQRLGRRRLAQVPDGRTGHLHPLVC